MRYEKGGEKRALTNPFNNNISVDVMRLESFTAPLSLINAVITALGVKDQKNTLASLQELERVWRTQAIYY